MKSTIKRISAQQSESQHKSKNSILNLNLSTKSETNQLLKQNQKGIQIKKSVNQKIKTDQKKKKMTKNYEPYGADTMLESETS